MKNKNNLWESCFYIVSLILLISIFFGYFLSSLVFGIWFVFCIFWSIRNRMFKFNKSLIPLLIFSVFSVFSIIWSQDQPQTLKAISRQLPLILFPIAGMNIPSLSREKLKQTFFYFSLFLCFFAIIMILMALLKYNRYHYKGFLYYHELVSPLKLNAIYVSYIFSTFFLIILSQTEKRKKKLFPILLILGVFLVMLSSKMILFVTGILAFIMLLHKSKGKYQKLAALGIILSVAFTIIKFSKPIKERFSTEFNTSYVEIFNTESFPKGRVYTGLEARFLQMKVFKEIINTPSEYIIGVGLGASKKEIQDIHKRLNTPIAFQSYNFHNQYIQVFTELGFIGLSLLLWTLIIGIKKSLKTIIFLPFIIITIALFFSESVIWRQRGIMFFGTMYVFLSIISENYESKKSISKI